MSWPVARIVASVWTFWVCICSVCVCFQFAWSAFQLLVRFTLLTVCIVYVTNKQINKQCCKHCCLRLRHYAWTKRDRVYHAVKCSGSKSDYWGTGGHSQCPGLICWESVCRWTADSVFIWHPAHVFPVCSSEITTMKYTCLILCCLFQFVILYATVTITWLKYCTHIALSVSYINLISNDENFSLNWGQVVGLFFSFNQHFFFYWRKTNWLFNILVSYKTGMERLYALCIKCVRVYQGSGLAKYDGDI